MEKFNFQPEAKGQNEKIKIYENPSDDPVYIDMERDILARTNLDNEVKDTKSTKYGEVWRKVNFRESIHGWSHFASSYPEKAAAYASTNEFLARVIKSNEKPINDSFSTKIAEESINAQQENSYSKMQDAFEDSLQRLSDTSDKFDELTKFTNKEKDPEKIKEFLETHELTEEEKHFLQATYYLRLEDRKAHGNNI